MICCCSLAGTAACINCPNNGMAFRPVYPPFKQYPYAPIGPVTAKPQYDIEELAKKVAEILKEQKP